MLPLYNCTAATPPNICDKQYGKISDEENSPNVDNAIVTAGLMCDPGHEIKIAASVMQINTGCFVNNIINTNKKVPNSSTKYFLIIVYDDVRYSIKVLIPK